MQEMQERSVQSLGWEDSPGEGNGNSLQYSCLESPVDGGAWRAAVHGLRRVRSHWATEHPCYFLGLPRQSAGWMLQTEMTVLHFWPQQARDPGRADCSWGLRGVCPPPSKSQASLGIPYAPRLHLASLYVALSLCLNFCFLWGQLYRISAHSDELILIIHKTAIPDKGTFTRPGD